MDVEDCAAALMHAYGMERIRSPDGRCTATARPALTAKDVARRFVEAPSSGHRCVTMSKAARRCALRMARGKCVPVINTTIVYLQARRSLADANIDASRATPAAVRLAMRTGAERIQGTGRRVCLACWLSFVEGGGLRRAARTLGAPREWAVARDLTSRACHWVGSRSATATALLLTDPRRKIMCMSPEGIMAALIDAMTADAPTTLGSPLKHETRRAHTRGPVPQVRFGGTTRAAKSLDRRELAASCPAPDGADATSTGGTDLASDATAVFGERDETGDGETDDGEMDVDAASTAEREVVVMPRHNWFSPSLESGISTDECVRRVLGGSRAAWSVPVPTAFATLPETESFGGGWSVPDVPSEW